MSSIRSYEVVRDTARNRNRNEPPSDAAEALRKMVLTARQWNSLR
jgi:hypothetical protein